MTQDPFGPGYAEDPFAAFDRLRAAEPVFWSDRLRRFVLTRHADVAAVLHDPAAFSSAVIPRVPAADRDRLAGFTDWSARWLFFLDPPEHTVQRVPVTRALSPRAVAELTADIAELARGLLAGLSGPRFDLLGDFAHPLAARVVADLLCAPGTQTEEFLRRARALERADADARDPVARRAGLAAMAGATRALRDGLRAGRLRAPVPAALGAAWGERDELVGAHSLMLLFAGVETTQNLVVNAVHALLHRPGAWAGLARDRTAVAGAVEEAARMVPPVLGVLRRATRDVTLAGRPVPAGAELVVMTAAANRDPARFADPGRFDPYRSPNPHLSFGLGPHYCPGAALTRLTARAALEALLERFPRLAPAGEPSWRSHDPIVHAPAALPVDGG
ncbi:cytochrome P450 [Dactylosporangium sp. CA-092794]|uniref:cytochrome P450 n=1 Tax=Dactylosporangium sp. CA-092794 TaxID=3239929 RepID=UPI003D93D6FA